MQLPSEGSTHWYHRDGMPCYEVPNKSKPDQMRSVTIRDARKLDLVPSVTGILGVVHSYKLERYLINLAMDVAVALPRLENEGDDGYKSRIIDEYQIESKKAADLGTRVHQAIEDWISEGQGTTDAEVAPMLARYQRWHNEHVGRVELIEYSFCGDGYGGRLDMAAFVDGRYAVVDFKTQGSRPGRPMRAYEKYGPQLAACERGAGLSSEAPSSLLNVMISTTEDRPIEIIDHTEKREECWQFFQTAFDMWRMLKRYDPRKPKKEKEKQ